jgi:arylsulfatase A-like enzyme
VNARPAVALALMGLSITAACGEKQRARQPHILLLTVDTLRADHTSLHGYARDTTPHVADFFRAGVVFDHAYATEASTASSVVSVLSGLQPQRHGIRLLFQALPADRLLLSDRLRDAGYATAAVISNLVLTDEAIALARHFDHYDDFVDEGTGIGGYERRASRTTDAALAWLAGRRAAAGPTFLWVHFIDPHAPYDAPSDGPADYTHVGRARLPRGVVKDARRAHAGTNDALEFVDRYDEEIAYTDREIGRLLDAYTRLGFAENAAVLFTSDHGETMREGEEWFTHGYHVYESILRVPLALRAPGLAARRLETPVSLVDVTPTLLSIAGLAIPDGLDGASLLRRDLSSSIYGEATTRYTSQWRALVLDGEKWVVEVRRKGGLGRRWRVAVDRNGPAGPRQPWETPSPAGEALERMIAADPDVAGIPAKYERGIRRNAPKVAPGVSKETLERLRALGYAD